MGLGNYHQWLLASHKEENQTLCASYGNYEIHSMKYFLTKYQHKSNQASRYNSYFMGSTVVEDVKYYHRVIKKQNPDCEKYIEHH